MIDELRGSAAPIARPIDDELYARVARLVRASDAVSSSHRIAEENQEIVDDLVAELGESLLELCPCVVGAHLIEARRIGRHDIEVSVSLIRSLSPRHPEPTIFPRPRAS